jgi:hypothetical protein
VILSFKLDEPYTELMPSGDELEVSIPFLYFYFHRIMTFDFSEFDHARRPQHLHHDEQA